MPLQIVCYKSFANRINVSFQLNVYTDLHFIYRRWIGVLCVRCWNASNAYVHSRKLQFIRGKKIQSQKNACACIITKDWVDLLFVVWKIHAVKSTRINIQISEQTKPIDQREREKGRKEERKNWNSNWTHKFSKPTKLFQFSLNLNQ